MKILFVLPYFYPKTGGLENYALNIAQGIIKNKKNEVIVVTSNHIDSTYKIERLKSLKIYRLPVMFKLSNTPIHLLWPYYMRNIIKIERPHIINGHTPVPYISDIAALLSFYYKIPYILTYQNDLIKENVVLNLILKMYYLLLGNITLSLSKAIISTSRYYTMQSSYLKKHAKKIHIIPPGVHLSQFVLTNKKTLASLKTKYKNKKILLFVGQLDKTHIHKGLHVLLHALSLNVKTNKNIYLLIIGKGDYIDAYKKEVAKFNIQKHVEFIGFVEDKLLPSYYKLADVVILPSVNNSEGFGMVLIEAGAARKPVIGTTVGGIPSVIDDKKTGFLVLPNNHTDLSKSIGKILSDKDMARVIGENGFKKVKKQFVWDVQVKKTLSLFKNTI